ncbi:helix-turn-helix domain-containing protein [Priestia flexa]|uniref:helix-turn-helix domain-containing protein n=1 Tax=Priestia flexa TaxID=86664 RepID=UPI003D2A6215
MLTTKEISEKLNVSEETVRRWIRTNELKATQEGKSYLVDENDLLRFIEKKSKDKASSIGKMASVIPIVGGIIGGPTGAIVGGATALTSQIIKKMNSKEKLNTKSNNENLDKQTLEDIEDYIETLERQKKKLELEYQMNVLQIEEEIAKYHKIKQSIKKEM